MIRRLSMGIAAIAIVGVMAAACGDDGTTTAVRTAPPGASPTGFQPVSTGNAQLDLTVNAALKPDVIELAGLTGYQRIACEPGASGGYAPPACRENEDAGSEVEVLPVFRCQINWVRPEAVPPEYTQALGSQPRLHALYEPTGGNFTYGAQYAAVIRTTPDGEAEDGVLLLIREGRVVAVEDACGSFDDLWASRRVSFFIVQPDGAEESSGEEGSAEEGE